MAITQFADQAAHFDNLDPINHIRYDFSLPRNKIYLCSNSLGLPAKRAFTQMHEHMEKWSDEGVHGWFSGDDNWYTAITRRLNTNLSKLMGAYDDEVVVMNSLTINLHLLFISFYRPTKKRYKIMIDTPVFPSDLYAVKSHLKFHGFDPEDALIVLKPRLNEYLLRMEDIESTLAEHGESTALVFLSSVNYLTGQVFPMEKITSLSHQYGCLVGFDLAHAAGNIPLELHQAQVDFGVGCTYKYLCSGPGGPGFAFVHKKHHETILPRFNGWWGNDPATRFQMNLQEEFLPHGGAASWQVSTPPILAMQPLLASLRLFDVVGMEKLREKSMLQTSFLIDLLTSLGNGIKLITPSSQEERGCQISIRVINKSEMWVSRLQQQGIICDFRMPDIIRVTPSPLYNSFRDIYQFALALDEINKNIQ